MKIGIVGAGGMAEYHLKGFRAGGAEITAIADANLSKGEAFSSLHKIPHTYASLTEMLSREKDIEAVSVITPNAFHKDLCIEALEAKRHVFCEKPPATTASDMAKMLASAKANDKILMFDFNNRARPDAEALKAYIDEGEIGSINSIQAEWIRRAGIPGIGGWFTNKALSGGGPVIDLVHMLDLALYFLGYQKPEWVLASNFTSFMGNKDFKGPWGIADNAQGVTNVESASHAMIRFPSGQCIYTRASWAEMNEREKVAITFQGTKAGGRLQRLFAVDGIDDTAIDSLDLFTYENHNQVNRSILSEKDSEMGRTRMAKAFIDAIQGKAKPRSTPEEALILMQTIEAIYRSADSGKPERI